jgi:hypothetical protein
MPPRGNGLDHIKYTVLGVGTVVLSAGLLGLDLSRAGLSAAATQLDQTEERSPIAIGSVTKQVDFNQPAVMAIPNVFFAEVVRPLATVSDPQSDQASVNRSKMWWILGSLILVGSLGGGLVWMRSQFQSSTPSPVSDPATDADHNLSGSNLSAGTQASASSVPQEAADLPIKTEPSADQALDTTTRLSSVDMVESLVGELSSLDGTVRRQAIWELGQRGHSAAIAPLVNGLLTADSQEKSLILAALAEISSRHLKPMHRALALGLQDPSPEVRKNAIRDLSRVYDTVAQLSPMLAHAAQDPDPDVQATAQWALRQLNRIPAAPYPAILPLEADAQESSHLNDPPPSS